MPNKDKADALYENYIKDVISRVDKMQAVLALRQKYW